MTERMEIYQCTVCGNVVEVFHGGAGQLWCCGLPMKLHGENVADAERDEHVPVVQRAEQGVLVRVGSGPHPMGHGHYIQWIEVIAGRHTCRRRLRPDEPPEAAFAIDADVANARAFCNLHGLWASAARGAEHGAAS